MGCDRDDVSIFFLMSIETLRGWCPNLNFAGLLTPGSPLGDTKDCQPRFPILMVSINVAGNSNQCGLTSFHGLFSIFSPLPSVTSVAIDASNINGVSTSRKQLPSPAIPSPRTQGERGRKLDHHDPRADIDAAVEVDHVLIAHPDAARRDVGADGPGFVGAVDAIQR
jgi:hypothetical protein